MHTNRGREPWATCRKPQIIHSFWRRWVIYVCVQSLSGVPLFATPWTVAHQAPLSTELSWQEYLSGLPFPPPGDLPDPGIKPISPAWADKCFTPELYMKGNMGPWSVQKGPLHHSGSLEFTLVVREKHTTILTERVLWSDLHFRKAGPMQWAGGLEEGNTGGQRNWSHWARDNLLIRKRTVQIFKVELPGSGDWTEQVKGTKPHKACRAPKRAKGVQR